MYKYFTPSFSFNTNNICIFLFYIFILRKYIRTSYFNSLVLSPDPCGPCWHMVASAVPWCPLLLPDGKLEILHPRASSYPLVEDRGCWCHWSPSDDLMIYARCAAHWEVELLSEYLRNGQQSYYWLFACRIVDRFISMILARILSYWICRINFMYKIQT